MNRIGVVLLICFSILPLLSLLQPGLPVTHDGQDHVARIANFYTSLTEGTIVPRWAGNLNWGYGHPVLMFLYPIPSYVASFIHAVGFSFIDSFKIVMALTYVGSIFLFYVWAREQWGDTGGFGGAILYGLAPYRFVDLYVRGAIGEHVAFMFMPLALLGVLYTARKKNKWSLLYMTVGLGGLILSHNAISLMFIPIIFLYAMYMYFYETRKSSSFALHVLIYSTSAFLASAFFWLPAYVEGKYTLRDIVTGVDAVNRLVSVREFFYSVWSYGGTSVLSKEIGLAQWFGVMLALVMLWYMRQRREKILPIVLLCMFFGSLFIMTPWATTLWQAVPLIQKFQFPWRFLSISLFCAAALCAASISALPKKFALVTTITLVTVAIIQTAPMWHPISYRLYDETYFTDIYNSTTDTGESSPIWSVRFMEKRARFPIEAITGTPSILITRRSTTKHAFTVQSSSQSRVVDNTLYFPGWNVFIDGKNTSVEFQDPDYRGLITFLVPPGRHNIAVEFRDTKLRTFANLLSLSGFILVIGLCIKNIWVRKK